MADAPSTVTHWLKQLRAGDEEAALGKLFHRYWPFLVARAQRALGVRPTRFVDQEDLASEAFWGFVRSLRGDQLPRLESRQHLMALLAHIVACRAASHHEKEFGTAKRNRGQTRGDSALISLAESAGGEPTPLEQVMLSDLYDEAMSRVPENLRGVATLHLAGHTNREIAEQLECVESTVERKMKRVRKAWIEAQQAWLEGDELPSK